MNEAKIAPNPDNYMIGKGVLSIAEITDGTIGEYVDVGNCPRFEVEVTEQSIEHESSRERVRETDAEFVLRSGYNLNFVLDEFAIKNLCIFLRGSMSGATIIYAGRDLARRYALKFVSANAAGPDQKWEFWKCKLTPNGTVGLISDEYATMSFSGKGLADHSGHATSPFFTVSYATTTTTSTTTTSV